MRFPSLSGETLVGDTAIPFYRWNWLEALESSGSTIPDQGWQPLHLALWRDETADCSGAVICEGP